MNGIPSVNKAIGTTRNSSTGRRCKKEKTRPFIKARLTRMVYSFLNQSGYQAVGCHNTNEAYDAMYGKSLHLIISDIMMPETDGYEFAKTVQSLNEDIPILFMTAREFNILYKLLSYPGKTFTRTQLMDEFWDVETNSAPRAVDVYMTKLRGKFEGCDAFEIQTVHGLGYKAVTQ